MERSWGDDIKGGEVRKGSFGRIMTEGEMRRSDVIEGWEIRKGD